MNGTPIVFRRWLFDDLRTSWNKILNDSNSFQLNSDSDVVFGPWKTVAKFLSNLYTMGSLKTILVHTTGEFGRVKYLLRLKFFFGC